MEILNEQIVEVPIKAILILLLIKAIVSTCRSAANDLKENKGIKGIIDEIVQLGIEVAFIVVLIAFPLNTWVGPIISVVKFVIGIVLGFLKNIPGLLK